MLNQILLFILTPSICMILGGITAIYFTPSEKITSMTQHFAAGVVFAAVAKEIFLGIATSATLKDKNLNTLLKILIILGLSLTIPFAAVIGLTLFKNVNPNLMGGILAFGTAALLYLVTEELLVEAHLTKEKFWMPMFFFLGFLLILVLEN